MKSTKFITCILCKDYKLHNAHGLCTICYNHIRLLYIHLESPLKKCECSVDCTEMIHSINIGGNPAKYKMGHRGKGKNHHLWKGGINNHNKGYIEVYHPDNKRNRILEHRLIMSRYIGRPLNKGEVVHHIDGNKKNNNIENLMLYKNNGIHISDTIRKDFSTRTCMWCKSNTTPIRKDNKMPIWARYLNGWLCRKCDRKRLRRLGKNS